MQHTLNTQVHAVQVPNEHHNKDGTSKPSPKGRRANVFYSHLRQLLVTAVGDGSLIHGGTFAANSNSSTWQQPHSPPDWQPHSLPGWPSPGNARLAACLPACRG